MSVDPRALQIRDLLRGLAAGSSSGGGVPSDPGAAGGASAEAPEGDGEDVIAQAIAAAAAAAKRVAVLRARYDEANGRLTDLMEAVIALVSLDYTREAVVSERGDTLDDFAWRLNRLAIALATSTVSKTYVSGIIESMNDLLIVADVACTITMVNQAVCELTGLAREELIGQPLDFLLDGAPGDEDVRCRSRDGSVPVAFSRSVLSGAGGEVEAFVCVVRDLRESKQAAAERWRMREAMQRQAILVEELSVPLIPITNEILVLPLVGSLDVERSRRLAEVLVQGVVAHGARVAIVDVTGMHGLGGDSIPGLMQAVAAARLVGTEVVVTGIPPRVASLVTDIGVNLGLDLSQIVACGSLARGLVRALELVNEGRRG